MSIVLIAGVDEVGRGPLAGPVIAGAVILNPDQPIRGLADSKKLSAKQRQRLAVEIQTQALACALGRAEVDEIDRFNILQASLLAMQRAILALTVLPTKVLVDGNRCPVLACPSEAIVKGDATVAAISAASIIAKVARDAELCALHDQYPYYGFSQHKGYPTAVHLKALGRYGPCPAHRRSFAPVTAALQALMQV